MLLQLLHRMAPFDDRMEERSFPMDETTFDHCRDKKHHRHEVWSVAYFQRFAVVAAFAVGFAVAAA